MPIPMTICRICGREVPKRSTLSLANFLGPGCHGRACRRHPEVEMWVAGLAQKKSDERAWKAADRKIRILMSASAIRVFCSFKGFSPEMCYQRLTYGGFSPGDIQEIKQEIERQGGPFMSREEIRDCIFSAIWVSQRQQELGL